PVGPPATCLGERVLACLPEPLAPCVPHALECSPFSICTSGGRGRFTYNVCRESADLSECAVETSHCHGFGEPCEAAHGRPIVTLDFCWLRAEQVWDPARGDWRTETWFVYVIVRAHVRDDVAVVQVLAQIRNRGPDPEFPFVVDLPEGAHVTGLTLLRDGMLHVARIADRAAARSEYDAWKAIEETGGLVEKTPGGRRFSYLVNVAEFTDVDAVLTYEMRLSDASGARRLDLAAPVSGFGMDLGARIEVHVEDGAGNLAAVASPADALVRGNGKGVRVDYAVGPRPNQESTRLSVGWQAPSTPPEGHLLSCVSGSERVFVHRVVGHDAPRLAYLSPVSPVGLAGSRSEASASGTVPAHKAELRGVATIGGGSVAFAFRLSDEPCDARLARAVALDRIQALEARVAQEGELAHLVEEIRALALAHGVVTDYTSFVVILPNRNSMWRSDPVPVRGIAAADVDFGLVVAEDLAVLESGKARSSAMLGFAQRRDLRAPAIAVDEFQRSAAPGSDAAARASTAGVESAAPATGFEVLLVLGLAGAVVWTRRR
ncbi:MAG TPA: VIT domain-containing protein, partial [Candidatus Thermoplasmatota archaeon]|nr:VIT domain-containing protein [Candidatus Thermoplasmatota archaeon]